MEPRTAAVVAVHVVVSLVFFGATAVTAATGDFLSATIFAVVGALLVILGVGIAKM